jgi:hypothetical protein
MQETDASLYLGYDSAYAQPSVAVKREANPSGTATTTSTPQAFPLLSLPNQTISSPTPPPGTLRRRSHTLGLPSTRHHPYALSSREVHNTSREVLQIVTMAQHPSYGGWSRSGTRPDASTLYTGAQAAGATRKTSDGDRYPADAEFSAYPQVSHDTPRSLHGSTPPQ